MTDHISCICGASETGYSLSLTLWDLKNFLHDLEVGGYVPLKTGIITGDLQTHVNPPIALICSLQRNSGVQEIIYESCLCRFDIAVMSCPALSTSNIVTEEEIFSPINTIFCKLAMNAVR
jgi:hypothetical protein